MSENNYKTLGEFLKDKILNCGKAKKVVAEETGNRPETISRLIASENNSIEKESIEKFVEALNLNGDERLEFYRLAGAVPAEITNAFVANRASAKAMMKVAENA